MARYTGPVCRLCRRQGEKLMLKGDRCSTPKCGYERHPLPPGQRSTRRRKVSERGVQLREKQKARRVYGVLEKQFRKHFASAAKRHGITGENLLQILETRLDSVVFRLGFADSRSQARQVVRHGHITLNGRKTDIPSCLVEVGDNIGWFEGSTKLENYKVVAEGIEGRSVPAWLSLDQDKMVGRVAALPSRGEIEHKVNEQAIVEYYSR